MSTITLDEEAIENIEAIASVLSLSNVEIVHLAIRRLKNEIFVDQQPDDGPLSEEYLVWLKAKAKEAIGDTTPIFTQNLVSLLSG